MSEQLKKYVTDLSELMKTKPELTDSSLLTLGQQSLALFMDYNYGKSIENFQELMQTVYMDTIIDLANGGTLLNTHVIGVAFKNGKLTRFTIPYTQTLSVGTVVCSIRLKGIVARESDAEIEPVELSQEQLNAAIYLLINRVSKL